MEPQLRGPRKLLALFVLLSGIPLIALGCLGWRVLQQDRALDAQRFRDRLETAAGVLTRELERELGAWEALTQHAADGRSSSPPAGAVLLTFDADRITEQRGIKLPFHPNVQSNATIPAAIFADAEALEFQRGDLESAAAAYERIARARSRIVRAAALMRLARVLRKQQRIHRALDVYNLLADMGDVPVAGSPSGLLGLRERVVLLESLGNHVDAAREAAHLATALADGRFSIDRSTFEFYQETAARFDASAFSSTNAAHALAEATEAVWPVLQDKPAGRTGWTGASGTFVTVWRRTGTRVAVVVADLDILIARLRPETGAARPRWSLQDSTGRQVWGSVPPSDVGLTKTLHETGLPWTIHLGASEQPSDELTVATRRNLFAASLFLMVLVIAASSYFVVIAVNRELRVARLQSDFVAAVSHEFRTPLTAMCHLTELLDEGHTDPGRVSQYHRVLANESRRLHAMVESLLDFGRIEAGRRTYELADVDAVSFVADTVRDFREQRAADAPRVHLTSVESNAAPMMIHVDRNALTVALRNLIDNAIKYSPSAANVTVSVKPEGSFVGISVDDEGPGVTKAETREIFRKFSRGAAARAMNVKGTGIGLTLAAEIVRAHGGRLELTSEPGRGSRFTTFLPLQPTHT